MEIAVEGDSFTPETQNNACVALSVELTDQQ